MTGKAKKKKKIKAKLKKSITRQKENMRICTEAVKKYMISLVKERAPGEWETIIKAEPAWKAELLTTFSQGSEMLLKKIRSQGLKWSDLTDSEKREAVTPIVQSSLDRTQETNEELRKLKNRRPDT